MVRPALLVALALGFAAPARADDSIPVSPPVIDLDAVKKAADDVRFRQLVQQGDRDRAAGRLSEAVMAYAEALQIRLDPLYAGRLGVLLSKANKPTVAADLLLEAIHHATNASPEERSAFHRAFDEARLQVCWLDVDVSHPRAHIFVDGDERDELGSTAFSFFVMPGPHDIRASLDGYKDDSKRLDACKGGTMRVSLTLTPLPLAPSVEASEPPPAKKPRFNDLSVDRVTTGADGREVPKQEDPWGYEDPKAGAEGEKKPIRGAIGVGPVMVLGVATWTPAIGVDLLGSFRATEILSIDVDARAAWLPVGIAGQPIKAMTAGGLASLCGHWRWMFGCATGHLGIFKVDFAQDPYKPASFVFFRPGIGGRLGADIPAGGSFKIRAAAEVLALSNPTRVGVGQVVLVEQAPVMIAANLAGVWQF